MYQDPTNFAFGGSQIGALPTTLDQINPSYYNQIYDFLTKRGVGRLSSVIGLTLYDTLRVDAGVLPTKDFTFFQNGIGQQQSFFVTTTTTYVKQAIDVHPWIKNGTLSKGYEALIWGIGVQFHTVAAIDESSQSSGNYNGLTLDPGTLMGEAATDAIRQANVVRAFQEGTYFKLTVNNTGFEDGPGWRFPSGEYGIGGGIGLAGVQAAPLADGALSNGFGFSYQMPVMRYLPELTSFGVTMSVQNPFTTANVGNIRVVVTLEGIGIQPVTG